MRTGQANRGRPLEELIERAFAGLPGVQLFRQVNVWVPLKGGKRGAFPARGAPVDFVGAVHGVPVALECKEVAKGERFPLNGSRLPEKEVQAMKSFEEAGGRSFLLVAFWEPGLLAVYPFGTVEAEIASGSRSLSVEKGKMLSLSGENGVPAFNSLNLVKLLVECKAGDFGPSNA
ncbi:Recombination protein U [Thermanaeromonas toyohensis ToBE]|uniref:Holliday junction resolvase RecU n=1 Tax=Thermanaeromonas toyohensis ToBE TaxID=698762 RepID=A0A1W1VSC2_9FIRM|nr:Holliday junction resolvase RecU [Thermanaeromonas toyohensis]SMB96248.1 Recombination protein U [Thermanaeromonas toyohensis ToBE]